MTRCPKLLSSTPRCRLLGDMMIAAGIKWPYKRRVAQEMSPRRNLFCLSRRYKHRLLFNNLSLRPYSCRMDLGQPSRRESQSLSAFRLISQETVSLTIHPLVIHNSATQLKRPRVNGSSIRKNYLIIRKRFLQVNFSQKYNP